MTIKYLLALTNLDLLLGTTLDTWQISSDRDTTCAIVGGIVADSVGADTIPSWWLKACEAFLVYFYHRDTAYTE